MRFSFVLAPLGLLFACSASTGRGPSAAVADPVAEARGLFVAEVQRIKAEAGEVDWDRVSDNMEQVVRLHDQIPEAWYNLGLARARSGNAKGAIEAYERAIQQRPDMHQAHENLAALYVEQDQPARAARLLERIVELQPAAAAARVALAHRRLVAERYDEVERLCREALAYEPKLDEAYCLLSAAARARTDWDRVRLLAGQGFKLDPGAACLHEALGDALRAEGRAAEALAAYDRALEADPGRSSAHARAAELSAELRDFPRAAGHLEAIVRASPRLTSAWVALGRARRASDAPDGAVEAFQEALRLDPNHAEAHFGLGWVLLRDLSDPGRAEGHLRSALQGDDGLAARAEPLLEEARTLRRYAEQAAQQAESSLAEAEPDPGSDPEPSAAPPSEPELRAEPEAQPEPEVRPKPRPAPRKRPPPRRPAPRKKAEEEEPEDPLDLPTDDDFE